MIESTKPWIITNGLDSGVVQYVGDILQSHRFHSTTLLGVPTWGVVAGRESLKTVDYGLEHTADFFPKYPPIHPLDVLMEGRKREEEEFFLNKSHSHFLLVDTGKVGVLHEEFNFRSALEKSIINEQGM